MSRVFTGIVSVALLCFAFAGFHPDRDASGTKISLEHHADSGGYSETVKKLGFNYRDAFHDYKIQWRRSGVTWFIDGKIVHATKDKLSHAMKTSLILRTNRHGTMPNAIMEVAHFRYTPAKGDDDEGDVDAEWLVAETVLERRHQRQ